MTDRYAVRPFEQLFIPKPWVEKRFANDQERLARFEREAQDLASLNHPHIAQGLWRGRERDRGVRS